MSAPRTGEELRAAAWRAQQAERALYRKRRALELEGSQPAAQDVHDGWAAIILKDAPPDMLDVKAPR